MHRQKLQVENNTGITLVMNDFVYRWQRLNWACLLCRGGRLATL